MQSSINAAGSMNPNSNDEEIYRDHGSAARAVLNSLGIVATGHSEGLLSFHELDRLEVLCRMVKLETVTDGDSGDKHTLQVGRFLKAPPGQSPFAVSETTAEVVRILSNPRLIGYLQGLLDTHDPICFRRGQVNIISAGGFVGPHIDRDADPDYQLVLILHLSCHYRGGSYIVEPPSHAAALELRPEPHTLLISQTDVNHWVEQVTEGERRTLVMFASTYAGPNRKELI